MKAGKMGSKLPLIGLAVTLLLAGSGCSSFSAGNPDQKWTTVVTGINAAKKAHKFASFQGGYLQKKGLISEATAVQVKQTCAAIETSLYAAQTAYDLFVISQGEDLNSKERLRAELSTILDGLNKIAQSGIIATLFTADSASAAKRVGGPGDDPVTKARHDVTDALGAL